MRIRHKIILNIGDDVDMKDLLFETDDTLSETIIDDLLNEIDGKVLAPMGGSPVTLSFGAVTAPKGCFIKVDNDCIITLNGKQLQMRKRTNALWVKLFIECEITTLTIAAPVATDLHGVYAVWGDVAT